MPILGISGFTYTVQIDDNKPTDSFAVVVADVLHAHGVLRQHLHTRPQAFAPILDPLTIPPAPMATQDSNVRRLPGAARPSFAPVTAFHKATQKPFRSRKRGRWGAQHVCIAWKIYYHEQLKKMQQKPTSLHREPAPEYLSTGLPGAVQHKEPGEPPCMPPSTDSPHGRPAPGNAADGSETGPSADHGIHFGRGFPRELREKPERGLKDLPLGDRSRDGPTTPELDRRRGGSLDRKRKRERDGSTKGEMLKRETVEDQFDSSKYTGPSPFSTTRTHACPHPVPVHDITISDVSAMYPSSSVCNIVSTPGGLLPYPGAEMQPYQTASWEQIWDVMNLQSRQNVLKDYSLSPCKAIGIPRAARRPKEAFHPFFPPPLHLPLALRQQETAYLRRRELLHSSHLHHAGYLAASYLEP